MEVDGVESEFFIAAELGMTVADLHDRMSMDEFLMWNMYYKRLQQREDFAAKVADGG